jgi:hypothetical protein
MDTQLVNEVDENETLKDSAEDFIKHAGDYLQTFYKKTELQITQKAVNTGAHFINGIAVFVIGLFLLLFVFAGLAFWIGDMIGSRAGGFFIMGGLMLLLLVILIAAKKSIVSGLRDRLTRKIYE